MGFRQFIGQQNERQKFGVACVGDDFWCSSACLELDQTAQIISYEEYHPFGTTSYRSGRSEIEVSLKRYKFQGKEKDEETGFHYHVNRYYAPWIARWISVDAKQHEYPYFSPYISFDNSPICVTDSLGMDGDGDKKTGNINAVVYFQFEIELTQEQQDAYIAQYRNNVRSVWNNFSINGVQVNVDSVVFAVAPEGMAADNLKAGENLLTVGNGAGASPDAIPGESYIDNNKLRNTGYMYYRNMGSEAAHEFGHLLGLADRYINVMLYSNDRSDREIGNRLQGIRFTLPLVLSNGEDGYNPMNNLYSGTGNSLTQNQLNIAFERGKNERTHRIPVLLHNSSSEIDYSAVKILGFAKYFKVIPYENTQNSLTEKKDRKQIDWAVKNSFGKRYKGMLMPHFKEGATSSRQKTNVESNWLDIKQRSR